MEWKHAEVFVQVRPAVLQPPCSNTDHCSTFTTSFLYGMMSLPSSSAWQTSSQWMGRSFGRKDWNKLNNPGVKAEARCRVFLHREGGLHWTCSRCIPSRSSLILNAVEGSAAERLPAMTPVLYKSFPPDIFLHTHTHTHQHRRHHSSTSTRSLFFAAPWKAAVCSPWRSAPGGSVCTASPCNSVTWGR